MKFTQRWQRLAVFFAVVVLVLSLFAHYPLETALMRAGAVWLITSIAIYLFAILTGKLAHSVLERKVRISEEEAVRLAASVDTGAGEST